MAGKLGGRGRLNAVVPGSLVHIIDQLSGGRYLVDTGASFNFPSQIYHTSFRPEAHGPDEQLIPCWGEKRIVLVFYGRRLAWTFLLADVQFPIIGIDFLRQNRLLVDPAANRLVDTLSFRVFSHGDGAVQRSCRSGRPRRRRRLRSRRPGLQTGAGPVS